MLTQIDVVNKCLSTLGEVPLSSLSVPHAFKGAALKELADASRVVQGQGWWFNSEQIRLTPSSDTGEVYLPGDAMKVKFGYLGLDDMRYHPHQGQYVQRGRRLYDLVGGTYVITESLPAVVVRELAFEDLPVCIADYVSATAVLKFQSVYDGDNNRRIELSDDLKGARIYANAEQTRQLRHNAINTNPRLQRIKRVTNGLRGY